MSIHQFPVLKKNPPELTISQMRERVHDLIDKIFVEDGDRFDMELIWLNLSTASAITRIRCRQRDGEL